VPAKGALTRNQGAIDRGEALLADLDKEIADARATNRPIDELERARGLLLRALELLHEHPERYSLYALIAALAAHGIGYGISSI
jgi:hypothetical protein